MSEKHTKAYLKKMVNKQLEDLNAMHVLNKTIEIQNDLIQDIKKTLREEIDQ